MRLIRCEAPGKNPGLGVCAVEAGFPIATHEQAGAAGEARFMAATHRDVEAGVREAKFREDLYYRLNVLPVRVPPLGNALKVRD